MKMKKIGIILLIVLVICLLNCTCVFANDENLDLTAKASLLIDNRTNKVLYSKNENEKMYPASMTKIVTAILALENCNLEDKVTASYKATTSVPSGYSKADIQVGEELTVNELLQMLLVHSANDAANVLAEYVGGSIDSFVSMMNTKANELDLINTNFTNSYGKQDKNHYTTATDLVKMMQYCLKNNDFRKIAGSASCAIRATNKSEPRLYTSTNLLIIPNTSLYYPYLTTGKTGFTSEAGECLISSAYKNDLELICVVFGSEENGINRFTETKALYEYGYKNYELKNIAYQNDVATTIQIANASKDTKSLDLLINETILALIKTSERNQEIIPEITLNNNITAPINEGDLLGKITYTTNGISYTTDLIAAHSVKKTKFYTYLFYIGFAIFVLLMTYLIFFGSRKNKYN